MPSAAECAAFTCSNAKFRGEALEHGNILRKNASQDAFIGRSIAAQEEVHRAGSPSTHGEALEQHALFTLALSLPCKYMYMYRVRNRQNDRTISAT